MGVEHTMGRRLARRAGRSVLWLGLLGLACADPAPVARRDAPPVDTPFVDRAVAWGLDRPHIGGGADKRYIVEAKGGGAALLDLEIGRAHV